MKGARRPAISVIVTMVHRSSTLERAMDAVTEQTLSVGGEVVLATADPGAVPGHLLGPGVRMIEVPGATAVELRAAALTAARGQLVAMIEDHVIVGESWVRAICDAHIRHPEALVVGGAVDNGSRSRLIDWANFLMTFGHFLHPITAARAERLPVIANLSINRAALPAAPIAPGEFEFQLLPRLAAEARIAFDDAPVVWHVQSNGRLGTITIHFHNARMTAAGMTTAGMTTERPSRGRQRRGMYLRRLYLLAGIALEVRHKPLSPRAKASLPLVLVLCVSHVAGEWVGATFGPGVSAYQVH